MSRLVHKCDPVNQDKLQCVHLEVMRMTNLRCPYRTENGYCAKLTDREVRAITDKLGRLEDKAVQ